LTVPTERGIAPGNGSLVAMIRAATGAEPLIAGKPEPAMHAESVRRSRARWPIIVGDRLDTDIEAGTRSGTPTLLVLTGVTSGSELLAAEPARRPTLLAADLRGLLRPHPAAEVLPEGAARCGAWTCHVDSAGTLRWRQLAAGGPPDGGLGRAGLDDAGLEDDGLEDDGLDALRAACLAAWTAADAGRAVRRLADDRPPACADIGG